VVEHVHPEEPTMSEGQGDPHQPHTPGNPQGRHTGPPVPGDQSSSGTGEGQTGDKQGIIKKLFSRWQVR
jgi:hypothetical protein